VALSALVLAITGDLGELLGEDGVDPWVLLGTLITLLIASYAGTRFGVPEHLPAFPSLVARGVKGGALAGVSFVAVAFVIVFAQAIVVLVPDVVELIGAFVLYALISLIALPVFAAVGAGVGLVAAIADFAIVRLLRRSGP
jgi:hypothetical protein